MNNECALHSVYALRAPKYRDALSREQLNVACQGNHTNRKRYAILNRWP
ncbi:MAG: hypothetical protein LBF90_06475 [Prevotellaceae bacterium]|jgi:hypothetical protein|nr:hypothetical protein [Prevotellaceae bacterium]